MQKRGKRVHQMKFTHLKCICEHKLIKADNFCDPLAKADNLRTASTRQNGSILQFTQNISI